MSGRVRNSNMELLRIISMYMIILIHANMWLGRFCSGNTARFLNGFVNGICNIGVTCFILISGYYGMRFKWSRLIKMECMMITYSLLELALIMMFSANAPQGTAELIEAAAKACMPVITRKYWFYSCYICLYLLSGFIEKLTDVLSQKEYQKLLWILLILFSIFPTLFYFEIMPDNGKGFVQMTMIYLLGRYFGKYGLPRISRIKGIGLFLGLWALNGISHEYPVKLGAVSHHLCKDNSFTNIVMAVLLFCAFSGLKFQAKAVNAVASCLFAAFALNNTIVSIVMDSDALHHMLATVRPRGGLGFIMLAAIVLMILIACVLVGAVRELLLGRLDQKLGQVAERKKRNNGEKA